MKSKEYHALINVGYDDQDNRKINNFPAFNKETPCNLLDKKTEGDFSAATVVQ